MDPMIWIYRLLSIILFPFLVLRLLWKVGRDPNYGERWYERFGFFNRSAPSSPVWVHAVSMGESIAARPIIEQLLKNKIPVIVTTTTATGAAQIKRMFNERVLHVFLPYDYLCSVKRFLEFYKPRMGLIMETELWPNLISQCKKSALPLFLVNARLSPKSAKNYTKIISLARQMLNCFSAIGAQTSEDAQRFMQLGAHPQTIKITGSIKFDIEIPETTINAGLELKQKLGSRPILVAGSTHATEETMVLNIYQELKKQISDCCLIIVPRHPERFNEVFDLCHNTGLIVARHTETIKDFSKINIYLGDTMGELLTYYAAADVVFVGGSFVNVGGHNLLEPAALGLATITGPIDYNFRAIVDLLKDHDALIQVQNKDELKSAIESLFMNEKLRIDLGDRARAVVAQNRGAVDKVINMISAKL